MASQGHMSKRVLCLVAACLFGGAMASGQDELPNVETFGPQIGASVPDFSLVDQFGATRDLDSLMGPNGLMLVFSRSADW